MSITVNGGAPLASDSGDGGALILTLDFTPGSGSWIHVFFAVTTGPTTDYPSGGSIATITDSKGGSWVDTPTGDLPVIGAATDDNSWYDPEAGAKITLSIGPSCYRESGAALVSGDTVTITIDPVWNPYTADAHIAALLFAFDGVTVGAVGDTGDVLYDNGLGFPISSGDLAPRNYLNYESDLSAFWLSEPEENCGMIIMAASYPGNSGYAPETGVSIGEVVTGDVSVAVGLADFLAAVGPYEQGGTWSDNVTLLVTNYQLIVLGEGNGGGGGGPGATGTLGYFKDGTWHLVKDIGV